MRTLFLHGFTQTGASWDPIISRLNGGNSLAPDLPGHGSAVDDSSDMPKLAARFSGANEPFACVGYSMGGRLALHIATRHPNSLRALVLISSSPGLESASERSERRRADSELANHIESIGVDAFLTEWLSQPLFSSLPTDRSALADRRRNTASGLAWSLRNWGTGAQESLWDELGRISCPVLLLTGARDTKFTAIARRMTESISDCRHEVVGDAGHAVHLERAEVVADLIGSFLATV